MSERRRYIVDGEAAKVGRECIAETEWQESHSARADGWVRALTPQADGGEAVEVPGWEVDLVVSLREQDNEQARLIEERDALRAEVARLKAEVDSLAESRLRCEQGWNAAIAEAERLTAERDLSRTLEEEMRKQIVFADDEIRKLTAERDDAKAETLRWHESCHDLEDERDALRGLATNERAVEAAAEQVAAENRKATLGDTAKCALQAALDAVVVAAATARGTEKHAGLMARMAKSEKP